MSKDTPKERLIKRFRADGRVPYATAEKKATEQIRRHEAKVREGKTKLRGGG